MKLGLVSLGCPKNLVDSEVMLGLIREKAFEITNDPSEADIITLLARKTGSSPPYNALAK